MSAMSEMAKAIRLEVEDHSTDGTLKGLDDETLRQYVEIVGALYFDLKEELERRE